MNPTAEPNRYNVESANAVRKPTPDREAASVFVPRTTRTAPLNDSGMSRSDPRTRLPLGSAADRAASGLRGGHRGGELDLTLGRLGNRYSGFLHIGGRAGDLQLSGAVYRHPRRDRHRYVDFYRYDRPCYTTGHYYYDYPVVSFHNHYYRAVPYYGYSYHCAYYNEPVFYHLHSPAVVYIERETRYVEVDNEPDAAVIYRDSDVGPPVPMSAWPAEGVATTDDVSGVAPAAEEPYQVLDDSTRSVIQEGTAAFTAGDYGTAQRLFLEAVMADERDGYAKLLHAVASFARGDYELAGLTARRALHTSQVLMYQPPDLRTLYADAETFRAHLVALCTYVDQHRANGNAKFLLGYVYFATGQPEDAVRLFSELAGKDDEDSLANKMYEIASSVEKVLPG